MTWTLKNSGKIFHVYSRQEQVQYYIKNEGQPEGEIKNGQSRETKTLGTQDEDRQNKKKHSIICVGHHFMQTHINNVNKT